MSGMVLELPCMENLGLYLGEHEEKLFSYESEQ